MKTYEFTVLVPELDDSTVEALYELCPDVSVGSTHGAWYVAFDREASSLEEAIQSGVTHLREVHVEPVRIELDVPVVLA